MKPITDEGAIRLLEGIIRQAREDYILDILWLADHCTETYQEYRKRDDAYCRSIQEILGELARLTGTIKRKIKILCSVESREADLVLARRAIKECEEQIHFLRQPLKVYRREERFITHVFEKTVDMSRIEEWAEGKPEVIRHWKDQALGQYLKDLDLPNEDVKKLAGQIKEDDRDVWIVFRKIRSGLTDDMTRKKRKRTCFKPDQPK